MKKTIRIILCFLLLLSIAAGTGLTWLTVREYRPDAVEELAIDIGGEARCIQPGESLTLLDWNIGYGALGAASDFFMDGGKSVNSADRDTVLQYLSGIRQIIADADADIITLQELDLDSHRSYRMDQRGIVYPEACSSTFAYNFCSDFVPYPLPPIGRVRSGLYTAAKELRISQAQRISLPCPFTWPVRTVNLKRCLSVNHLDLEGSDRQLAVINLHLEAYDGGDGNARQFAQLMTVLEAEYEKGNYVIAAGDFNQCFPDSEDSFPNLHADLWNPASMGSDLLPEDWKMAYSLVPPTCRLLNQPYDPNDTANTQYYVIDGFLVSPNISVEKVQALDLWFACSDHNPVLLTFRLNA